MNVFIFLCSALLPNDPGDHWSRPGSAGSTCFHLIQSAKKRVPIDHENSTLEAEVRGEKVHLRRKIRIRNGFIRVGVRIRGSCSLISNPNPYPDRNLPSQVYLLATTVDVA